MITITWTAYQWPPWVPDAVRAQVEDVWPTPMDWTRNSNAVNAPRLGTAVHLPVAGRVIAGWYVHLRNFTGRVVARDHPDHVVVVVLDRGQPTPHQVHEAKNARTVSDG